MVFGLTIVNLFNELYNVPVDQRLLRLASDDGISDRLGAVHVLDGSVRAARSFGALQLRRTSRIRTRRRSHSASIIR